MSDCTEGVIEDRECASKLYILHGPTLEPWGGRERLYSGVLISGGGGPWGPSSRLTTTDGLVVPPSAPLLQFFPRGFNCNSALEGISILPEWHWRDKQELAVRLLWGRTYRCLRSRGFQSSLDICQGLSRDRLLGELAVSCTSRERRGSLPPLPLPAARALRL